MPSHCLPAETVLSLPAQAPPEIAITNSVLLEWPQPAESCIVVAADSLSNPVWTPWPEPIFRRAGKLCMAVPATKAEQYFKLVPGTQFSDDFSDAKEPFATRNPWVSYTFTTADKFSFTVTNGVFRFLTLSKPVDGRIVLAPPGSLPVFRDFTGSVDFWGFTGNRSGGYPIVDIFARARIDSPFPGNTDGYLGSIRLHPGSISIWNGKVNIGPSFTYDPTAVYRLQFSAVGSKLTLRLVNLTTGEVIEQTLTDARLTQGCVTLVVEAVDDFGVAVDNFLVTGTKP